MSAQIQQYTPGMNLCDGLFAGVPFSAYRAANGLNSHYLMDMLRSPMHARHSKQTDEDSKALKFGRLFHTAVLEPAKLWHQYEVVPEDVKRNTKEGKAAYAELEASGKELVTASDMQRVDGMVTAMRAHAGCRQILGLIECAEVSAFWTMNGTAFKCRFDALGGTRIIELKSTRSAEERAFERDVANYKYDLQAALYREAAFHFGLKIDRVSVIASESEAPYGCRVFTFDEGYLDTGREALEQAVALANECVRTSTFPGYSTTEKIMYTPAWKLTEEAE